MKDPGVFDQATLTLDDTLFGEMDGCVIKKRAAELCIPVQKSVESIESGNDNPFPGQDHQFDRLCYKVRCPKTDLAATPLQDQFGARTFEKFKTSLVCTPAVKGPPPVCGNDVREVGEDCDGSDDAACAAGGCRSDCTCPFCGDSVLDPPEECDPPAGQGGDPSCNDDCTLSVCGDSVVGAGEACDPPFSLGGAVGCKDDCSLALCGDAVLEAGEECETDLDCSLGEVCVSDCACLDARCPGEIEVTMHAGTGLSSTATELDSGWTGRGHDADLPDQARLDLEVCAAAGASPGACGELTICGIDQDGGNCRCSNDRQTRCSSAFGSGANDCPGGVCECYLTPPAPVSHGNVPYCSVRKLSSDITGTWNADSGEAALDVELRQLVYLGTALDVPCPTCEGDPTPDDGIAGGTCSLGENDGGACDANSFDATFPAPSGGAYSYDCLPDPPRNVASSGIPISHVLTTGSQSLPPVNECGFPPFVTQTCPCGVCSDDSFPSTACESNADCAACTTNADCGDGDGACDAGGRCQCGLQNLGRPRPNSCDDGGACTDLGAGEGECADGSSDLFCDGALRANGRGYIHCAVNSDCAATSCAGGCGACTLSEVRACFPDSVDATGTASAGGPTLAAAYCRRATAGAAFNAVYGYPGPERVKISTTASYLCAGDPLFSYPLCP